MVAMIIEQGPRIQLFHMSVIVFLLCRVFFFLMFFFLNCIFVMFVKYLKLIKIISKK